MGDGCDVNGTDADPLYAYLRGEAPGDFGPGSGPLHEHIRNTRPEAIGTDEIELETAPAALDARMKHVFPGSR